MCVHICIHLITLIVHVHTCACTTMCMYAWICVGMLAWVDIRACTHMLTCVCMDRFLCIVCTYYCACSLQIHTMLDLHVPALTTGYIRTRLSCLPGWSLTN